MLGNISLGRYYPADSVLHRLDPRTKLLGVIVFMILIFMSQTVQAMGLLALLTIILIMMSNVPVKQVLMGLKPILFILIFAFVLNVFSGNSDVVWFRIGPLRVTDQCVYTAIRMAVRLALLILNTTLLLTLTTTPVMVSDAMEKLLKPLSRFGFPAHEMAMMMSIALRFVPTLLEETEKIMKAQSSRGADYDTGGLISKARGLVSVLIPLFVSAFKRAEDLATAMEARCYRGGEGRTRMKRLKFTRTDSAFMIFLLISIAAVIILQYVI
jgi:energy-coupling factor transport system permease protein